MTRISPLPVEALNDTQRATLAHAEQLMGFIANDVLTMAHWPEFLDALKGLVDVVYAPGALDSGLKQLVATVSSQAAGCRYCQAHSAHGAVANAGVDREKLDRVWSFETDPLFSEGERAALRLAVAAGSQPNAATDEHFEALRNHYSEQQVMELMGVLALFGLLNRWNTTLDTDLESEPSAFARSPRGNVS